MCCTAEDDDGEAAEAATMAPSRAAEKSLVATDCSTLAVSGPATSMVLRRRFRLTATTPGKSADAVAKEGARDEEEDGDRGKRALGRQALPAGRRSPPVEDSRRIISESPLCGSLRGDLIYL